MICLACGRILKSQKSKELGYGPKCYRRIYGSGGSSRKGDKGFIIDGIPHYEVPGQISIDDYLQTLSEEREKESAFATL